jgi:2-dehydropantoate 2-reductase
VFLCVKSFQTEAALATIAPCIGGHATVVSLQNGMNEEAIAAAVGRERTVGGVVVMDGSLVAPGIARQENSDERSFTLGSLDGATSSAVPAAAEILGLVGEVRVSDNVWGELWSKLVHNCMINAVCALAGQNAARAWRDPAVWPFAHALGREAVEVSQAEGVVLGTSAMFGCNAEDFLDDSRTPRLATAIREAYPETEDIYPSMAQDVAKGRPTEIQFLNGWIVGRGRAAGIATPANAHIVELIGRVERGELAPGEPNKRLLAETPAATEGS